MTAFITGDASDYLDLFERFRTFITSHSSLVAAGQQWTELRYSTSELGTGKRLLMLRGPGLAGEDEIFVNLITDFDAPADWYNWGIYGATGYSAASPWNYQPGPPRGEGPNLAVKYMRLWNNGIKYWFVADGRCFKILAKVSTTYQHMFGGFFLPYATPSEYPYPILIGAMGDSVPNRWSGTSWIENAAYWLGANTGNFRWLDGQWFNLAGVDGGGQVAIPGADANRPALWPKGAYTQETTGYDGTYRLRPLQLTWTVADGNRILGVLPGVYHVTGQGNASENIITIAGKDYLVAQNGHRTSRLDYIAMLLE